MCAALGNWPFWVQMFAGAFNACPVVSLSLKYRSCSVTEASQESLLGQEERCAGR